MKRNNYGNPEGGSDTTVNFIDFRRADLQGANFQGADLQGADFRRANFQGANLYGADLYGAKLQEANFQGANLQGAKLKRANLQGANFYGTNLQGASFYGANLCGADLKNAKLSCTELYWADLRGTNFQGADLQGAKLYWTKLQGANFQGANLGNTVLDPMLCPNSQIEEFETYVSRSGEVWVKGYRTQDSPIIQINEYKEYKPGQWYEAQIFSCCTTECHPGLYLYPTVDVVYNAYPNADIITVWARAIDVHKAGSQWRCRAFWVDVS